MPFPTSGAAPAPAFAPPAAPGMPPQAPAAPAFQPPAPPAVQQPALPNLWCVINGAAVMQTPAQYLLLPPTTQAHHENGTGGWKPLSAFLPAAAAAPLDRAAFQAPAGPAHLPQQAAAPGTPDASLFAGMETAQISRRGSFITQGDYILKLNSAEMKTLRASGKLSAIFETTVIVSSYNKDNPATHAATTEGSGVTIFIQKNESFNGNMKELYLALCGFDKNNQPRPETDVITGAEIAQVFSPNQPFAGVHFYCEARQRLTQANKEFTNMNYWPMPVKADGTWDMDRLIREIR